MAEGVCETSTTLIHVSCDVISGFYFGSVCLACDVMVNIERYGRVIVK